MAVRLIYRGAYMSSVPALEHCGFSRIVAQTLTKIGIQGAVEVVITSAAKDPYPDGLCCIEASRFGVDMVYAGSGNSYTFYIVPPENMLPQHLLTKLKAAKISVVERYKYTPPPQSGKSIVNRSVAAFVAEARARKEAAKKVKPLPKPPRQKKETPPKKSDNRLWVIARGFGYSRVVAEAFLVNPSKGDIERLADVAYEKRAWRELAELNSVIDTL